MHALACVAYAMFCVHMYTFSVCVYICTWQSTSRAAVPRHFCVVDSVVLLMYVCTYFVYVKPHTHTLVLCMYVCICTHTFYVCVHMYVAACVHGCWSSSLLCDGLLFMHVCVMHVHACMRGILQTVWLVYLLG